VGEYLKLLGVALACVLLLTGCVAPARTFRPYEADAVATAQEAQSAVQTALLASEVSVDEKAYGNYLSALLGDTEDTAAAVQSSFDSEQPPSHAADQLRNKLDGMLQKASAVLIALRIHARRGQLDRLNDIATPLQKVSKDLDDFVTAHQ
jgi:PBP1b-binding outer membrane lipoprotein LpoB